MKVENKEYNAQWGKPPVDSILVPMKNHGTVIKSKNIFSPYNLIRDMKFYFS